MQTQLTITTLHSGLLMDKINTHNTGGWEKLGCIPD